MSEVIVWSDDLSIGIDEIDEQHKVLVDLLNELTTAIQNRQGSAVAGAILNRLADYTRIHFTVEESMMRLLGYPDYEGHKAKHDELIDQMVTLQRKLESEQKAISFELLHFLRNWLTKHIKETDRYYAGHFLQVGVQGSASKGAVVGKLWSKFWG